MSVRKSPLSHSEGQKRHVEFGKLQKHESLSNLLRDITGRFRNLDDEKVTEMT